MTRSLANVRLGVVVTTCAGREENLQRTLSCLAQTDPRPEYLVVVFDGSPIVVSLPVSEYPTHSMQVEKHRPGLEQPRNAGVRRLRELLPEVTHVWFLDSDLVFKSDVLAAFERAYDADPIREIVAPERLERARGRYTGRILMGPYEWLAPDVYEPDESSHNDIRWRSFNDNGPEIALIHDLGAALGCFSGNLLWPIDEFIQVGGFWNDLHHGRCEDGELGLRAASAGIPMSLVREARAWHVAHSVNMQWCIAANERDVPMLNARHPWVQEQGVILTESDGARFDYRCEDCQLLMNFHDSWNHVSQHRAGDEFTYEDPGSVRPS